MTHFFKLAGILPLLCATLVLHGQNETDALRYSLTEPFGTARASGMAGAFGALGGDFTSLAINPAGIAVYRRSEMALTFGISGFNTNTDYKNEQNSQSEFQFHVPQIGMVGVSESTGNWKYVNYGIGYNKLQNFNQSYVISGKVNDISMTRLFADQAFGTNFDELYNSFPYGAGLAWETYLIDPVDTNTNNQFVAAIPYGDVQQRMDVRQSGHMGETVFTVGGNYNDNLFVGATLGLPVVRFNRTTTYRESDIDASLPLDNFTWSENLSTSGSGVNIKLGAIYRVNNLLRLHGAWHSPSSISLTDTWTTAINSEFKDGSKYSSSTDGVYQYRLKTPGRVFLGAAFIIGKAGLVSADYEMINYSNARLRQSNSFLDDYDFKAENNTIEALYRNANNVRIGTEWRVGEVFRVRGGYAFQQNPFAKGATNYTSNIMTYSGGVGYRGDHLFVDLGYQYRSSSAEQYLFDPANTSPANLDMVKGEVIFGVGLRY
ncbi:MAG: hypothetical protein NWR73_11505 [Flavobacteriales bacterium]|nr:hypothetical protein [Flavobacteriales bacterium]